MENTSWKIKDWAFFLSLLLAIITGVSKFVELDTKISTGVIPREIDNLKNEVEQLKKDVDEARSSLDVQLLEQLPIGTIIAHGGEISNNNQKMWLPCDGRILRISEYEELFEVIAQSWGGDNKGGFYLPDLRGRFLRGVASGSSLDPDASSRISANPGGNTGDAVGSVQDFATAMPREVFTNSLEGRHRHKEFTSDARMHGGGGWGRHVEESQDGTFQNIYTDYVDGHTHTINGGDKETRPINANVNWMIKVK